jgi:hypothetical protein
MPTRIGRPDAGDSILAALVRGLIHFRGWGADACGWILSPRPSLPVPIRRVMVALIGEPAMRPRRCVASCVVGSND